MHYIKVYLLLLLGYTESLVFEECDKIEHCLVLPIENDDQVEDEEHLNIISRNTYERGNVLLRNGTLTIFDSDGMKTCIGL